MAATVDLEEKESQLTISIGKKNTKFTYSANLKCILYKLITSSLVWRRSERGKGGGGGAHGGRLEFHGFCKHFLC